MIKVIAWTVGLALFVAGFAYAGYLLDGHAEQSGRITACQKEDIEC